MNNELQIVIEQTGLEKTKVELLLESFSKYFTVARDKANSAKDLVVTSPDQREEMSMARTMRIELKTIRSEVEHMRKHLKEQSLREGKAIDGAANIIKALIVPVEEHLERQEKFLQIQEEKRKAELLAKRISLLSEFVDDVTIYNLSEMEENVFCELLDSSKRVCEEKIANQKKEEQDRIDREKKVELYNSRKEKLIPYWMFLEGDQPSTDWGEIPEESFQIILRTIIKKKHEYDLEQERVRKENEELRRLQKEQEEKMTAERQAKEKAEEELRLKRESEEKAIRQQEEVRRQADLAPDKEKMRVVYSQIQQVISNIDLTKLGTPGAHKVAQETIEGLQSVMSKMAEGMQNL